MKISNPDTPFERIEKDANGNDEYGFRNTFGQEEIVNLKTGKSNMSFYQPEKVFTTAGCSHDFKIDDISKREFICSKCNWGVTVHINDIEETPDGMFIKIKEGKFKVS